MLIKLAEALQRRQKAARTAEWLIWTRGGHGLDIARHAALDHHRREDGRVGRGDREGNRDRVLTTRPCSAHMVCCRIWKACTPQTH
jgi:hypothetical protein